MRAIDEDELKQKRFPVDEQYNIEHGVGAITAYKLGWNDAIDSVIKSAQTIDAVKVVRCKDCKYSVDYYQDGNCYCRRPSKPMEWIENGFNWFCADGERRTE